MRRIAAAVRARGIAPDQTPAQQPGCAAAHDAISGTIRRFEPQIAHELLRRDEISQRARVEAGEKIAKRVVQEMREVTARRMQRIGPKAA